MKYGLTTLALVLIAGAVAFAATQVEQNEVYNWRYKITVTVETPEGEVSGSAVRQMGNDLYGSPLSQQGNPADVRGEAVVVDLGERGVLFSLISHESDSRFYDAFPLPGQDDGQGGSSPQGIQYHASLPIGTKGVLDPSEPPGYPNLVMFSDMGDPLSVTLIQKWEREKNGRFKLADDRFEGLFGSGVKLKEITLEITDEPVTWGVVDQYLPWLEDLNGGYLHGGFTSKGAPLGLHGGNFKRNI